MITTIYAVALVLLDLAGHLWPVLLAGAVAGALILVGAWRAGEAVARGLAP